MLIYIYEQRHLQLLFYNFYPYIGKIYEPAAKSQLKKNTKLWQQEVRKAEDKARRDADAAEATRKKAEEARKVTIVEDKSLPPATRIKIDRGQEYRDKRVKVSPKTVICGVAGNMSASENVRTGVW